MLYSVIIFITFSLLSAEQNLEQGFCDISSNSCENIKSNQKFLFYDVNPPEGFNLRRDVYMRFAIMLAEAQKIGKGFSWRLVLPPWHRLYHWKSETSASTPIPWSVFFDIDSLKSYAPVVELHEVFSKTTDELLEIDRLYVLHNFEDAFENGVFKEKWEITQDCNYVDRFWGYRNVTVKEIVCVKFQGKISKLWELVALHPLDRSVMFSHGEIPLHDSYGTKSYWDCRKSMKFNKDLTRTAKNFISQFLSCKTEKCSTYISIHWRRQDFARSRQRDIPSLQGTIKQIHKAIENYVPNIEKVFIASDASTTEIKELERGLQVLGYKVYYYVPSKSDLARYKDGGVAIIDQIICSHAAYFIGTHESTFTYRIQEEREILGFNSSTTFNRLCPHTGKCEKPSMWTIVN
ncbi:unnamed protein product [Parnassius mnemosyne]|uniref:GDP-fucose protein O-fucosyltransferase 2 n=1 Tax=Parnassius mnemosyne TaxID=213953 RepID=A0AAV1KZB8_9NEOP